MTFSEIVNSVHRDWISMLYVFSGNANLQILIEKNKIEWNRWCDTSGNFNGEEDLSLYTNNIKNIFGFCGKLNKNSLCMVDEKCSKHYPLPVVLKCEES